MRYTYLLIDLFTILVPLIFSFHSKIRFNEQWKRFLPALFVSAILFIAWDICFTYLGVWNFNPKYVIGVSIAGLPIEELLFFICVPYSCVFTYYCLTKFYRLDWPVKTTSFVYIVFSLFLLVAGLINLTRLYTSVTFISTSLLCLFLRFYARVPWLGKATTVYIVLLLPFLVVNGLLTGTGLNEAVVGYNDAENLGWRILTIPVEDSVYGFELYLLNLYLYQYSKKHSTKVKLHMKPLHAGS